MIEDFFDMSEAFPLAFDEDRHLYYLRGYIVPSVTQILREISGFPETEEGFVSEAAEIPEVTGGGRLERSVPTRQSGLLLVLSAAGSRQVAVPVPLSSGSLAAAL